MVIVTDTIIIRIYTFVITILKYSIFGRIPITIHIMASHQIEEILEDGARRAAAIADPKLDDVKKKIGLEIKYQ